MRVDEESKIDSLWELMKEIDECQLHEYAC
jgi:hypothetical protein